MNAISYGRWTALAIAILTVSTLQAQPRTFEVGPDREYSKIAQVTTLVKPGDTVLIYPGEYHEAVFWRGGDVNGNPITIRGVGATRPAIDGNGVGVTGSGGIPRALFQIEGNNYVVENLEFRNAKNGRNAAGIRIVGSRRVTIRNCKVTRNDMGIMSSGDDELLVEYSEISFNGSPDYNGFSHNFYLQGDRVRVRYCYIHDSTTGENFKAYSRYVELLYNYIADAHDRIDYGEPTKEVGLQSDPTITTVPNSHAVLIGNTMVKRGNGVAFLDFGPESDGGSLRNGTLFLINNTIIREGTTDHWTLRMGNKDEKAVLYNNIFYGGIIFSRGPGANNVTGSNNWFPEGAQIPESLTNSFFGQDPGFLDRPGRDYRLRPDAPSLNLGTSGVSYLDADGYEVFGLPTQSYRHHMGVGDRNMSGPPDLGAFELGDTDMVTTDLSISGRLVDNNGKPLVNWEIYLQGDEYRSVRTQADGGYRFTNLRAGGNYTVAPWADTFSFLDGPKQVSGVAESQTIDFRAPSLYSIRGRVIGTGDVGVSQTLLWQLGSYTSWTATDSDGNYEFRNFAEGGTYPLRASRAILVLPDGGRKLVENLSADTTVDFVGTFIYNIVGNVADASGRPLGGVKVALTGTGTRTTTTGSNGNYSFTGLPDSGTYRIAVDMPGIVFSPDALNYSGLTRNESGANFQGPQSISLSGQVVNTVGMPIAGISVRIAGTLALNTTSDSTGRYQFNNLLPGGTYSLTAVAANYTFPGVVQKFDNMTESATCDIMGRGIFTIQGTVTDAAGNPIPKVVVSMAGSRSRSTATDANGKYTLIQVTEGDTLSIKAVLKPYNFAPAQIDLANILSNQTNINFKAQ